MTESQINLGPGQAWASPRGADEYYRRLIRYMVNFTLAEFMELANTLEEDLPHGQTKSEFIAMLKLTKALTPEVVRQVLLHPVWIYWVRSSRQIAYAWRESKGIAPQWLGHLHPKDQSAFGYLQESLRLFPHLVLAAHLLSGKEIELVIKARGLRFLSLPGTGFSGDLSEDATGSPKERHIPAMIRAAGENSHSFLLGPPKKPLFECSYTIKDGRVHPVWGEGDRSRHWLTVVELTDWSFEIDHRDTRILENWVSREVYPDATEVRPIDSSQIPAWNQRLSEAFEVLKRCSPLLEEELSGILRSIVPVESNRPEHSVSCSSRDFWGAIQLSPHPGAALAEVLAHEYRHNILNALLDVDSLIDDSCTQCAKFFSPWRPDPRPLLGVLHGIYSFVEVVGFYQSYLDKSGSEDRHAALAEERIISNTCRLQIAARELAAYAKFTRFGSELFDGLQHRIDRFDQDASDLNPAVRNDLYRRVNQQYSDWQQATQSARLSRANDRT